MSEARQHTPGPWTPQRSSSLRDGQHDFAVHATKAKVLAKAFGRDSYGNIISAEANARLIAAAPDLLNALKRLVEWNGKRGVANPEAPDELLPAEEQSIEVAEGMAAIARAEGRSNG